VTADRDEARRILQQAIESVANDDAGAQASFAAFATSFLHAAEGRPLQTHGAAGLIAVARSAFEFAQTRARGECLVRLRSPAELPGRSVIEILQDDRPFLVDTLRLFLRRHQLQEQMLLHPTLSLIRDESGTLQSVGDAAGIRESMIYVEFHPSVDEERLRSLEVELTDVMRRVAQVTEDHRIMIREVREIGSNIELAKAHLDVGEERVAKIIRFLDWLIEDQFVFMGTRRYDVRRHVGELEITLRPGGLGMWRDNTDSRFIEPQRGAEIPIGLRLSLEDPRIVQVMKGWTQTRIHRAGRIDRILVKEIDENGELSGFSIIAGLFGNRALRTPCSLIPLLAERLDQILETDSAAPGSHRYKAIVTAFDSAPMEFLFGASVEDNATLIREIIDIEGAEDPRVVLRTDASGHSFYAAVILPRERYSEELRGSVRDLLASHSAVGYIDDRVSFLEEGTALLHFFCTLRDGDPPQAAELEAEVEQLATRWEEQLTDALIAIHGAAEGGGLAARYVEAFSDTLRVETHPADAVRDVEALEALSRTGEPQIGLFRDRREPNADTSMLRIYLREERLLSDLLPLVNHFGIRVVDARQSPVVTQDRGSAFIHALRILPLGGDESDLDAIAPRLGEALRVALEAVVPDDALNALVLVAGLDWREVDLIRTYLEYINQIQTTLTRAFVREILLQNPIAVRAMVELHAARLAPGLDDAERKRREEGLREQFERYRDRISSLNEDRALGAVAELIEATLRTNFFAHVNSTHRIAIKLDPSLVSSLKPPHAYREVFVHGSGVDGIHIRGGPVARGGIRWSDRLDDFRTEVLGLMRTQQLKNGLIIPVGAKGGFILRAMNLSPPEARKQADEAYRVFISGLLDLTDNIDTEGHVVPPVDVFRRDADDPYLVVAADKGTAHLSDAANELALERGFWLGDAFASGGSVGYDHKKYAITARGAWECVKHHLSALGIDPEQDKYGVAGIGDMSGDVFGNGLLLMRKAKLVAAFDHRHIFLDPDPDPERAWQERNRLFALPRSSWSDYDPECISRGGGVWSRSAKRIDLAPEASKMLGLDQSTVTGPELVRAVLRAPVDLLWNGGIGTYVKSSEETHADVGDRANESVRIDAPELRARIIGEGGNLGLTQAARVEAAIAGVRLDTDAIHNSAGVDLSDHEVNYKILLARPTLAGSLTPLDRANQLAAVADDACESVLAHNRAQVSCISLDETRSQRDLEPFRWAIEMLCDAQGLVPGEIGLPDEHATLARQTAGHGLARPELAVLLGLAKLHVRLSLATDALDDRPSVVPLYESSFPTALRERFPDELREHRLRREMTALAITNQIIDSGGVTAITTLIAKRGLAVTKAADALLSADEILGATSLRESLLALRGELSLELVDETLLALDDAIHDVARYLLGEGLEGIEPKQLIIWRHAIYALAGQTSDFLSSKEADALGQRVDSFVEEGIPVALARSLAGAPLADRGLNIVRLIERAEQPAIAVARAYTRLGEETGINWVYRNLARVPSKDLWDRMVLTDLRTQMLSLQRELTEHALHEGGEDHIAAVDAFLELHRDAIERIATFQPEVLHNPTASALTVVTQALVRLRPSG
jgi:glutamate dehydrogenase